MIAVDLRRAKAQRANFTGADLRGARLNGAKLQNAILVDADLREAELHWADLSGADLTGAKLDGAAGAGAPDWRDLKIPALNGPVKDNARTRWPSGFPEDLLEVFDQAGTPAVRSREPQGGRVIACGMDQCSRTS